MQKTLTIHPDAYRHQAFVRYVEQLPQSFDHGGVLLYAKRNVIRRYALADGTEFVTKRFKRPALVQRLVYTLLRPTKSSRTYRNALELARRGVATPRPMAYADVRRRGLVSDCFYVCEACDWTPIVERLNKPEQFDRPLARAFACFVAELHDKGVLHGDLNSTNTLFRQEQDDTFRFCVIDINRMAFTPAGQARWADCRENLTRFTGRMDLFDYVARAYAEARGLNAEAVDELLATKRRHDRRWRRRKSVLRRLKNLFRHS